MSSVSIATSTSLSSVDPVAPRTQAQIDYNHLTSSSSVSSDIPTEHNSTRTRTSSASAKRLRSSHSSGSARVTAISQSQSPSHSRRQTRSTPGEDIYGPQHLEHEYSLAYEELRSATIYALYRLGYTNPKRRSPEDKVYVPSLAAVLAARFPDVERARRRINEADSKLQEALENGHTWHNTPWPNYRVIFDEKGMAVDVVEVQDDEDGIDEGENEIRQLWARFETRVFKSSSANKECSDPIELRTKRPRGRPKRKCREDADGILDNCQRRKLESASSLSSLSSDASGQYTTANPCPLRGLDNERPLGRRPGLRSANTTRNR